MSDLKRGTFFGSRCPRYAVIGGNLTKKRNFPKGLKVRHETREDAEAEAWRLAEADPGSLWYVAHVEAWFLASKRPADAAEVAS